MKSVFLMLSILFSVSAQAAMPFTISGDKINAIFRSEMLWPKIGGAVETIVFKGHTERTSKFAVTTTEYVKENESGATRFKPVPCLLLVSVTAIGDSLAPEWKVTDVDFTGCPKTSGK